MLEKTISYRDFMGNEREEVFRFNLSQTELVKMDLGTAGTLTAKLEQLIKSPDVPKLMKTLDTLIEASYGVISDDGRMFVKNEEEYNKFRYTAAYDKFMTELLSDDKQAAAFIENIMPPELMESVRKERAAKEKIKDFPAIEGTTAPASGDETVS